ncbi:uncharacterized protein CYBJADRAFT_167477 [Cyberlindnera jadinii NRRL Y-1542]|uniref:Uncharacterized protein n=1 Tax=Cyberlindnera jadinii (strain ATCC 18201 / CBS 1600 / BCRC 20928 / JCM 3617 / NBRC 0987 / NRRL Y-1542) TaxID=983966 RepID=A0A1E4RTR4_CYBJN|nr:hypothetical protein CYBJADRAFT_170093 [Cyberlindnera jadinii NRRL Y-1542]XP_020071134.1 hypothetical protein CYBJADRAFT_167477 [Cyberlindnera jadinii NRRL Y-1542]ODV70636.1 hypothetical protein CYBJADRAFT_170093 [Cyberlindnera jadinii NRRL Y-1542]ODV74095.1 hypothetical protein CYBJADRAFT_167477 [Cyberlindnera jadinii NRRL Y-1542]
MSFEFAEYLSTFGANIRFGNRRQCMEAKLLLWKNHGKNTARSMETCLNPPKRVLNFSYDVSLEKNI